MKHINLIWDGAVGLGDGVWSANCWHFGF